jgi:NAD(P)-dependent dehydrogenase (short-subunit alcohol dehydrogenase family)
MASLQQPVGSGFGITSTAADVIHGIELAGKVAIVTGGYSDLGRKTAHIMLGAGPRVIVPARDVPRATTALSTAPGVKVEAMDLFDPGSIDAFAERFVADAQPLHLLVNNAALADPVNGIVGVAGPDKIGLDDLVRRFLKKTTAPREVVSDPKAPYLGLEINDRSLKAGEGARIAATHFDDWLNTSAQK